MAITLNGTTGISSPGGDTSVSLSTGTLSVSGTSSLSGNISFPNSTTLTAASTKTLTLNGGGLTNGLVLDASNNVGIGTSSPAAKADVAGTVRSTSQTVPSSGTGAELFYDSTNAGLRGYNRTGSAYVTLALNDNIYVDGGSSGNVKINGNLGLGVTPSAWGGNFKAIQVAPWTTIVGNNNNGGASFNCNMYYAGAGGGTTTYLQTGAATQYLQQGGSHIWQTVGSGTGGTSFTFTQAMTLDASGNLLVGNTSAAVGAKGLFYAPSPYNSSTYNPLELGCAGAATVNHQLQKTTVSTTATTILSTGLYASLVVVFGSDGTNRFIDLVLFGLGTGTVNVISSLACSGIPAARTYSQASSTYKLAMASGTYTVQAYAMSMTG